MTMFSPYFSALEALSAAVGKKHDSVHLHLDWVQDGAQQVLKYGTKITLEYRMFVGCAALQVFILS